MRPGVEVEGKSERAEQVFIEIKPALALDRVFEVSEPESVWINLICVVCEVQPRESVVCREAYQSGRDLNFMVDRWVLIGCAVIIAEGYKRTGFERDVAGIVSSTHIVANCRAVLTINHEDTFLQHDAVCFVSENRIRIQTELF